MKKSALVLLTLVLTFSILWGAVAVGVTQIPHEDPTKAENRYTMALPLLNYADIISLMASRNYSEAGDLIQQLESNHVNLPEEVQFVMSRFNNLAADLTERLDGLDAVLTGKAELATAGETPIAMAAVEGKPLSVVATICEIDRAILIIARKDRGISGPHDLRGRRVGVVEGTTADFFLHIYLITSYVDPKDVTMVPIVADRMADVLLNGEVDAVSTWTPHTIILQDRLGSNAIVLHDSSIYTMTWNLVAAQDFVKTHPGRIVKFLRAVVRANGFIREKPEEAKAVVAAAIGAKSPLFNKEWKDFKFDTVLEQSLIVNLEDQARWFRRRSSSSSTTLPDFTRFIHTDGLKAVRPEAVVISDR